MPKFVTVASSPDQDVPYDLAWVHVNVVPLVSADSAAVQKQYLWANTDPGPFMTPEQYEAGWPYLGIHFKSLCLIGGPGVLVVANAFDVTDSLACRRFR